MFLTCYLAQDDEVIPHVQERLALAKPPVLLVSARSVPEVVGHLQTLPVRAVLADIGLPRETWLQLNAAVRPLQPGLPILALSPGATEQRWWEMADDLLRLDEHPDLFQYRLARIDACPARPQAAVGNEAFSGVAPVDAGPVVPPIDATDSGLLHNPQFRSFATIFTGMDEHALIEGFVSWVPQACPTSRVALLLRDAGSGDFVCRAKRGLPSTLVPHCTFPQTAPICRWLTSTGRILLRDAALLRSAPEVAAGLDLMQAVVAVPILYDGQLVGMLVLGPRMLGQGYTAAELEGLFTLGEQVSMALHHCRLHRTITLQQEMNEHMLGAMPTGAVVLGADHRIAFLNDAAGRLLGKPPAALQGKDLRALPSPMGDLAYEILVTQAELPRRELALAPSGTPVAVTGFPLSTTPPSSMLLLEDLSALRQLEEEIERRVDLEVVTNLVHYLAHELRNPLVTLSTFASLAPSRAGDPDFHDFCESLLQSEIGRVNLILEQLLILADRVEFEFDKMALAPLIERITGTDELRGAVVIALPILLPPIRGDLHRLETAFTCILRSSIRLSHQQTPAALHVALEEEAAVVSVEIPYTQTISPEWLLNPWDQLLSGVEAEQQVDLGLATAKYIIDQHEGELIITIADNVLTITCRLPLWDEGKRQKGGTDATESSRRRR